MFGSFLPLTPCPPPFPPHFSPTPSCFQAETVLPLPLILLKSINNNKDKAFLLVEIRIAIQGDS
jgi:hypothetical protein